MNTTTLAPAVAHLNQLREEMKQMESKLVAAETAAAEQEVTDLRDFATRVGCADLREFLSYVQDKAGIATRGPRIGRNKGPKRKRKHLDEATKERLIAELKKPNANFGEIADKFGLSRQSPYSYAHKFKIPLPSERAA